MFLFLCSGIPLSQSPRSYWVEWHSGSRKHHEAGGWRGSSLHPPTSQSLCLDAFGWTSGFFFYLSCLAEVFSKLFAFLSKHLPHQTLHRLSSSSLDGDLTEQKMRENSNRVQRARSRKGEQEHQACALCRAFLTLCKALVQEESGNQILF